jgi:regulator of Ty1 transposition protein 109
VTEQMIVARARSPRMSARVDETFLLRTTSTMSSSLLDHISTSLATFPGHRSFQLQLIRSVPRRSHALFPHATNLKTKIYQQELLLVVSESLAPNSTSPIPIFALEASIYSIPATSTSLIYISKVDTTGLIPASPSPASAVVTAFLSYHLIHPPHQSKRVRIHIFAKSQSQYLFPGSVENPGKKVLDDKALIRWWKRCITSTVGVEGLLSDKVKEETMKLFYLIPGLSYLESLPYVPKDPSPLSALWIYSHPYSVIPSPLLASTLSTTPTSIGDHIPSFPDDPKSRFQTSLTSSSVASSGDSNDYDDVMASLSSTTFTSLSSGLSQRDMVERERSRERERLKDGVTGGVEEWWERMAWRQECCSGVLVGFFVIALDTSTAEDDTTLVPGGSMIGAYESAIPHANFTALWSQFHNVDYALTAVERLNIAASKWTEDVKALIIAEGHILVGSGKDKGAQRKEKEEESTSERRELHYLTQAFRIVEIDNPVVASREKRGAEVVEEKTINKMVPRKKVKKVVE